MDNITRKSNKEHKSNENLGFLTPENRFLIMKAKLRIEAALNNEI